MEALTMGIFTRVRDIVNSNVNVMLEKAENPEKLIKLMIREMEDTLVEVKASCAGAMATQKRLERESTAARGRVDEWTRKSELAMDKGREDLAREALIEKRRHGQRAGALEEELAQCSALVGQYQADIMQLEDKLASVREKQRVLLQRQAQAQQRKRKEVLVRKADTGAAVVKFEGLEQRIERMESEADLVNFGRKPSIEEEFARLEDDEEIERELDALRAAAKKPDEDHGK